MTDSLPVAGRAIALDGHDGSGKSSVAAALAARGYGSVVKPFSAGLGDYIAHLWGNRHFAEADRAARFAVRAVSRVPGRLIFDRHWLTMATVLPERYMKAWERPKTVVCWADLPTTIERLRQRGEEIGDLDYHRFYLDEYRRIADRAGVAVVETTSLSVAEAATAIAEILGLRTTA